MVQKGFQLKGKASIVDEENSAFKIYEPLLLKLTRGKYPFKSIIDIKIESVKMILAPSYIFYANTKEEDQIAQAKKSYGLDVPLE